MHETEKVAAVNAQRSNRQICCFRRHPPGQPQLSWTRPVPKWWCRCW